MDELYDYIKKIKDFVNFRLILIDESFNSRIFIDSPSMVKKNLGCPFDKKCYNCIFCKKIEIGEKLENGRDYKIHCCVDLKKIFVIQYFTVTKEFGLPFNSQEIEIVFGGIEIKNGFVKFLDSGKHVSSKSIEAIYNFDQLLKEVS